MAKATLRTSERLEDERLGFIASKPVRVVCQIAACLSNRFLRVAAAVQRAKAIDARILGQWRIRIARKKAVQVADRECIIALTRGARRGSVQIIFLSQSAELRRRLSVRIR